MIDPRPDRWNTTISELKHLDAEHHPWDQDLSSVRIPRDRSTVLFVSSQLKGEGVFSFGNLSKAREAGQILSKRLGHRVGIRIVDDIFAEFVSGVTALDGYVLELESPKRRGEIYRFFQPDGQLIGTASFPISGEFCAMTVTMMLHDKFSDEYGRNFHTQQIA